MGLRETTEDFKWLQDDFRWLQVISDHLGTSTDSMESENGWSLCLLPLDDISTRKKYHARKVLAVESILLW